MLVSLGFGLLLIVLLMSVLVHLGMVALQATLLVIALALAAYLPVATVFWPGADVLAIHIAVYVMTAVVTGVIFHHRQKAIKAGQNTRLHPEPAAILAFFAVLVVVNALFLTLAQNGLSPTMVAWLLPDSRMAKGDITIRFPGTISHDFQKKESLYNAYLQQVNAQHERGWQIRRGFVGDVIAAQPAQFRVEARDRDGELISNARVHAEFLRPANRDDDQQQPLAEVAPGVYEVAMTLPYPGRWDLVLLIEKDLEDGPARHEIRGHTTVAAR